MLVQYFYLPLAHGGIEAPQKPLLNKAACVTAETSPRFGNDAEYPAHASNNDEI